MKVIILAGGFGTRLSEETNKIPKPMIKIGNKPIISHIMDCYKSYDYHNFILLSGYKKEIIKKYYKYFKQILNKVCFSSFKHPKIEKLY